jgi:hypothetical protein
VAASCLSGGSRAFLELCPLRAALAEVGAGAFFHRPIDGDAAVHRFDQVAGDGAQGGVAEDLDGSTNRVRI